MKTITIEGQMRTETGKKHTRAIRSQGLVPCVIYGGSQEVNFAAPVLSFKNLVYTAEFLLAKINVEGKSYSCILKDVQLDKVSDELAHLDFLELVEDKKVVATIPIHFTGIAAGVKGGGKLVTKMKTLKVKTFPKYLKEFIDVDLTNLELNENIRVEDVKDANYEILNSPRIPIASVVMTRLLKQEEAAVTPAATVAAAPAKGAATPAAAPAKAAPSKK